MGRGLSLADTQTGREGRLYSRRRLGGAKARCPIASSSSFSALKAASLRLFVNTDTGGTGPIPHVTVFRVKAYSGGVLARALSEGLRYLST